MPLRSILEGAGVSYQPAEEEQHAFDFSGVHHEKNDEPAHLSSDAPEAVLPAEYKETQEYCAAPTAISDENETDSAAPELPGSGELRIIGIMDDTYILALGDSGLLVVDQHAAHERVLYEKFLSGKSSEAISQKLLFPITLELSRSEAIFIEKYGSLLEEAGFEIESFGNNTVIVNAIPASVRQDNVGGLVADLLSELTEKGEVARKIDLDAVAMAACKAAVKANDRLTVEEAESLLRQMAECDLPFSCPHGRPTVINISSKELEKRFGRR
jgi:DNA mismatch repair protein MutL